MNSKPGRFDPSEHRLLHPRIDNYCFFTVIVSSCCQQIAIQVGLNFMYRVIGFLEKGWSAKGKKQHNQRKCGLVISTQSQPKLATETDIRPSTQTASFKGLSFDTSLFGRIILLRIKCRDAVECNSVLRTLMVCIDKAILGVSQGPGWPTLMAQRLTQNQSPPSPSRQPSPAMLLGMSEIASASTDYGQVRRQDSAYRRLATDAEGPGGLMSQFSPASSHYHSHQGNAVSPFHRHSEAPEVERWLKA
ncbi:hypothetical protein BDP81DRAFT_102217 [Colletotrichum phormii]|uniref:Uncharacterized protein n=1 Tax=Colletotrichum phormii TaxID=359342 RepID=A0AAJ0EAR8_9PEZI|nr:uncharacterized protein BDP81DRAFT_102217 [Colletotrichum phormii]KAK1624871.1 hypothetical protein BDP81DRAFT_102217 [Colletotrichum phormii]